MINTKEITAELLIGGDSCKTIPLSVDYIKDGYEVEIEAVRAKIDGAWQGLGLDNYQPLADEIAENE